MAIYSLTELPLWLFCEEARKNETLYVQACGLLHQGKRENEGNETEDTELQTLTPGAELEVSATPAAPLIHPPLPPPSRPTLPQFLTPGLGTSPPSTDRLENPVLVSGAQDLAWHCHLRSNRAASLGQEPPLGQDCLHGYLRHACCVTSVRSGSLQPQGL